MTRYLTVTSRARTELIEITADVQELVREANVRHGLCHLFVLHTTAGITVNEGADPAVQRDLTGCLNRLVPDSPWFTHAEGNSDAHVKSTLVGVYQCLFIEEGKLLLGTWQSVYFCEFDGPRQRKVAVRFTSR